MVSGSDCIYKSHLDILSNYFQTHPTVFILTLIATPWLDSQMVVYLELLEVYGRENGGGVFLWLVSNIKVLVTASYVMGKCRTGVFVSVFCNVRETMELPDDRVCLRNSAVSLYYLEIPNFTLVGEAKVLKYNVKNIYSALPKLCSFLVLKVSCVRVCTMFLA